MDYVVFGTGYGATLMLLGWVLRTFGPGFRYRVEDEESPPGGDFLLAGISWRRFAAGLGALIATAGMVFILMTLVLILFSPSNETGMWISLGGFALVLVAAAVWCWLYVSRYGTFGIVPAPRPKEEDVAPAADEVVPAPATEVVAPADANPVAVAGVSAESGIDLADERFAEPEELDEGAISERDIRMSRYQIHRPEPDDVADADEDATDEDDEVAASEDVDLDDEAATLELVTVELPASYGEAPDPGVVTVEQPVAQEPGPDGEIPASNEPDDASGEMVDSGNAVPEAEDQDDPESEDDDPVMPEPTGVAVPDNEEASSTAPLEDTPEGRAEALRRIQAIGDDDPSQR